MIVGINHISVAVKNLDQATKYFVKAFGISENNVNYPHQPPKSLEDHKLVLISVGNADFEFAEPVNPASVVANFIENHGEGITHICFEVDDINEAMSTLSAQGITI